MNKLNQEIKREIVMTEDGSHTLYVPELDEHYHSSFGAIQESYHIYIQNAFNQIKKDDVKILEVGFGTGLNCLLTAIEAKKNYRSFSYYAVEKYPLSKEEIAQINYGKLLDKQELFMQIHTKEWTFKDRWEIGFTVYKKEEDIRNYWHTDRYDLIYFDAFAPEVQPELWTVELFSELYRKLNKNGIFITYSSKGTVKQALREAGFYVQRLPGPKGKRHIIRATKVFRGEPQETDNESEQAPFRFKI